MIHLDNATVTRPSDRAIAALNRHLTEQWFSPSAPYSSAASLAPYLKDAYEAIYDLLDASKQCHFVFTSSGTEAVNHVALAAYQQQTSGSGRNHFLAAKTGEASSIMGLTRLEEFGCVAKLCDVDRFGRVTVETLRDAITPRTALLSLSSASGITGVIQPTEEIAELCRERGIWLHVDASHHLGKAPFPFEDSGADLVSFDGATFHAPLGAGGLFWRPSFKVPPLLWGGSEQGGGRAGNFSVGHLAALGEAAHEAGETIDFFAMEASRLRRRFEEQLLEAGVEAQVLFAEAERLPHISCISFPGAPSEALLYLLNQHGVTATLGGGNQQQIALQLSACGVEERLAGSALSFALSRETTASEVDKAVEIISTMVKRLRKFSGGLL